MLGPAIAPTAPEAPPWPSLQSSRIKEGEAGKENNGGDRCDVCGKKEREQYEDTGTSAPWQEDEDHWLQPQEPSAPGWGLTSEDLVYADECPIYDVEEERTLREGPGAFKFEFGTEGDALDDSWKKDVTGKMDSLACKLDGLMETVATMSLELSGMSGKIGTLFQPKDMGPPPGHTASPPTRSPVTYAGLLPGLHVAEAYDWTPRKLVAAIEMPRRLTKADMLVANLGTIQRTETVGLMMTKRNGGGARAVLAGTDALGFCLPPDGHDGLFESAGFSALDEKHRAAVGTDVRVFCGPPNPLGVTPGPDRVDLGDDIGYYDYAGTEVLGFRVPPDGRLRLHYG